ncbi:IspE 4-diphosphocytidyl-2C-methyl-D-erythritol 2-phosphate synthase [Candidatus Methylopumilus planktonicus]|uniref:4-(cytidine 5'-diphospho)-2-C-methyl-D-erythritol kinase n=1 Tax=Candidatus Methylopumilus planktonicus TaxID=1581557 RepID=UPI003BEF4667
MQANELKENGYQEFLAPAKLNLFLHVINKRLDGYHNIQTVFQLIDLYDNLFIKTNKSGLIRRTSHHPNIQESDDLIIKAAHLLKPFANKQSGADIFIKKTIPMAGGLGGGSSDAATVLIALNALWDCQLTQQELQELALKLGADVPFFIFGQNAWAEGIGEKLTPFQTTPQDYLVIAPRETVSTREVFESLELTKDRIPLKIAGFSNELDPKNLVNDLEKGVLKEFKGITLVFDWLNQFGRAKMTGSGSCFFISLSSVDEGKKIAEKRPEHTLGFVVKGLNNHPHFNLMLGTE